MIIETINSSERTKLYLALESNLSSFRKRSMLYTISAHSESIAGISLYVTGKRGTVTKDIVVSFNKDIQSWEVFSEGKKYTLVSLSEISAVIRSMIAKMSVTINKI
jgi:hypothetical protein